MVSKKTDQTDKTNEVHQTRPSKRYQLINQKTKKQQTNYKPTN